MCKIQYLGKAKALPQVAYENEIRLVIKKDCFNDGQRLFEYRRFDFVCVVNSLNKNNNQPAYEIRFLTGDKTNEVYLKDKDAPDNTSYIDGYNVSNAILEEDALIFPSEIKEQLIKNVVSGSNGLRYCWVKDLEKIAYEVNENNKKEAKIQYSSNKSSYIDEELLGK